MSTRAILILLLAFAAPLRAQSPRRLGPVDGAALPPTDTARVAIGSTAPDFTLESREGPPVTLSAYKGRKRVILVFYRGHW